MAVWYFSYFCRKLKKMFLPFGTLAPGILLPLLAFAYMLFFGSCALSKTAGRCDADNHEVQVGSLPEADASAGSYSCFSVSRDDLAGQGLKDDNDTPFIRQMITWIIDIPDKDHIQNRHLFSHFTRPPPSMIQA